MRLRLVAGLMFLAALALRLLVAAPAQADVAAAGDAFRRVRDERRSVGQALGLAERREARRERARTLMDGVRSEPGDPVLRLRRDVVAAVGAVGVSRVRLAVLPSRPPVAATLRLSARGSLLEANRLSSELTNRWGLVLDRVRFAPEDGAVAISIDGLRLLGGS